MVADHHSVSSPVNLWIDADPSGLVWTGLDCDDDLAILASLYLNQTRRDAGWTLAGLSICGGNAPLEHTWADVQLLLSHAGSTMKPHRGHGWRSMHVPWKVLNWLHRLAPDMLDSDDASDAIIVASKHVPLTILTLGPTTNLAKALDMDLSLASRIAHVHVMGGELTHSRMDLNIMSDRSAARTIVNANIHKTFVPIQLCAQIVITEQHVKEFERNCCPTAAACALLPKMRQQVQLMPQLVNRHVIPKMTNNWNASENIHHGFIPWDMVALLTISHPEIFDEWKYHYASFEKCGSDANEPCDGTMVVRDYELSTKNILNYSGVIRVPHIVKNETEFLQVAFEMLCNVPGKESRSPPLLLGFLGPAATGLGVVLVFLLWRL